MYPNVRMWTIQGCLLFHTCSSIIFTVVHVKHELCMYIVFNTVSIQSSKNRYWMCNMLLTIFTMVQFVCSLSPFCCRIYKGDICLAMLSFFKNFSNRLDINSLLLSNQSTLIFFSDWFPTNALNFLDLSKNTRSWPWWDKSKSSLNSHLWRSQSTWFPPLMWSSSGHLHRNAQIWMAWSHQLFFFPKTVINIICLQCNPHKWMKNNQHVIGVSLCQLPCYKELLHSWSSNAQVEDATISTCPLNSITPTPPIHPNALRKTWCNTSHLLHTWWPLHFYLVTIQSSLYG